MINNVSHFIGIMSDISSNLKGQERALYSDLCVHNTEANLIKAHPITSDELNTLTSSIQEFVLKNAKELSLLEANTCDILCEGLAKLRKKYIKVCNPESAQILQDLPKIIKHVAEVAGGNPLNTSCASLDPLFMALLRRDRETIQQLLGSGSSTNLQYINQVTLLDAYFQMRKQKSDPEILKLLLEHGALKSDCGYKIINNTAVLCFFMNPDLDELQILLNNFSTYPYSRKELKKITEGIFFSKAFDFFNTCLDAKVPLVRGSSGFNCNPYIELLKANRGDLIRKLSSSPCSSKELLGKALEKTLIDERDIERAKLLVEAGAQLEKIDLHQFIKIYRSNHQIYTWLIEQLGTRVTQIVSKEGINLLHLLLRAETGYLPIENRSQWLKDMEKLIVLGISPTEKGVRHFDYSPLEIAGKMKQKDVCKLFVSLLGKDPKNSPLHEAILNEDVDKIKEFLIHPMYLTEENACIQTPFDLVVEKNKLKLLPLFAPYCDFSSNTIIGMGYAWKFTHEPILNALQNHHCEMAKALWDLGYKESFQSITKLCHEDPVIFDLFQSIIQHKPDHARLLNACETNDLSTVKQILEKKSWLMHFSCAGKTALGVAVSAKSIDVIRFLLDSHPDLPSLEELLNKENEIPREIQNSYDYLKKVLSNLVQQKDLKGILLLASHPKTKEFIMREGIVQALIGNWHDIETLKTMIQAGFDLNGICKRNEIELWTPLLVAIYASNITLTKFIIDQGATLEPFVDSLFLLPPPLTAPYKSRNIELLMLLLNAYQERRLPIPWDLLSDAVAFFPEDDRLLVALLEIKSGLTTEENKIIAKNLSQLIFDPTLDIRPSIYGLLNYGVTHLKSAGEWNRFIDEAKQFAQALNPKYINPQSAESQFSNIRYSKGEESETSKLMNQIYYHILCGMNSQLNQEPQVIARITKMLLDSPTELHDRIMLALQTGSSLDEIEEGIKFAELLNSGIQPPPAAFFKIQGNITPEQRQVLFSNLEGADLRITLGDCETFKFFKENDYLTLREYLAKSPVEDIQQLLEGWINYYAVYRTRIGLLNCNRALKYQKNSNVILKTLVALERIGINCWSKTIENAQIKEIVALIKTSSDLRIKSQACRTLWALSNDEMDENLKTVLAQELSGLNIENLQHKAYALTLIELLGNFVYSDSNIGKKTAKILRQFLQNKDNDIAFQAALTISKTDDRKGLLECLKVIEGPVWDIHRSNDGKNAIHSTGTFLMFRQRPIAIHDNRHAIQLRILDRLAQLEASSSEFTHQIQQRLADFMADPCSNPELEQFVDHFHKIPRNNTRYVGMPLYFPSGSAIGRGLSSRKGDKIFFESVRDLIRKGCGTTDLTLETAVVEGQTWGRIGHTFGSHNPKLFFNHEGTYFHGSNSAFLVIATDYYNSEFMRGDARLESEHTFNTLWYRGVPRKHLQAVFLEKQNRNDIELLAGDQAIESIKDALTSPIFKNQSVKELVHLRRHLKARDCVMIKGKEVHLSLAERIRYYDSTKQPSLPIEDVEDVGYKFMNEKDLLQESLKRAIGRQLIRERILHKP